MRGNHGPQSGWAMLRRAAVTLILLGFSWCALAQQKTVPAANSGTSISMNRQVDAGRGNSLGNVFLPPDPSDPLARDFPKVDLKRLALMESKDIAEIGIYVSNEHSGFSGGETDPPKIKKIRMTIINNEDRASRQESQKVIAGLVALSRSAGTDQRDPGRYGGNLNRVLIVQPKTGAPFEIEFGNGLLDPVAGNSVMKYYSLELKEALWALGGEITDLNIIHFLGRATPDRWQASLTYTTLEPGAVAFGDRFVVTLRLSATGQLMLHFQVWGDSQRREVLVDEEKPFHFSQELSFVSQRPNERFTVIGSPAANQ